MELSLVWLDRNLRATCIDHLVAAFHAEEAHAEKNADDALWGESFGVDGELLMQGLPAYFKACLQGLTHHDVAGILEKRKQTFQEGVVDQILLGQVLQRLAKVLEDGGIKIDSVASTLTTLSAQDMIEALINGERDPVVLAELARGRMRSKIPDLRLACAGRFDAQHALMCTLHLEHIDHLTDMIARLDTRIDEASLPCVRQTELLATIPGISERAAQVIISEIGVDMTRFPTASHLASWAGLGPGNNESAGRHRWGKTRKGNTQLCTVLTECAWSAGRTATYVGAQFRRFHRRFGNKGGQKTATATAHTLVVIIWHVLAETTAYRDLGSDYFARRIDSPQTQTRRLIREPEALGHKVTIEPAA